MSSISPNPHLRAISAPIVDESPVPLQPTTRQHHSISKSSIVAAPSQQGGAVGVLGEDPSGWIEAFVTRCQLHAPRRSSFCNTGSKLSSSSSTLDTSEIQSDVQLLLQHLSRRRQHLHRQLMGASKAKIAALGGKRPKGFLRLDTNANRVVICPSLIDTMDALEMADRVLGASFPRGLAVAELMLVSGAVRSIPKYDRYDGVNVCRNVAAVTSQAWLCASKLLRSSHAKHIFNVRGFEPILTQWVRDTTRTVITDAAAEHSSVGNPNEVREAAVRDTQVLSQLFEYGSVRNSFQTANAMKVSGCDTSLNNDGSTAEGTTTMSALAYLQDLQHTVTTVREYIGSNSDNANGNDLIVIAAEIYCADFAKYQMEVVGYLRGSRRNEKSEENEEDGCPPHVGVNVSEETASPINNTEYRISASVPHRDDEPNHLSSDDGIEGPLHYGGHDDDDDHHAPLPPQRHDGDGGEDRTPFSPSLPRPPTSTPTTQDQQGGCSNSPAPMPIAMMERGEDDDHISLVGRGTSMYGTNPIATAVAEMGRSDNGEEDVDPHSPLVQGPAPVEVPSKRMLPPCSTPSPSIAQPTPTTTTIISAAPPITNSNAPSVVQSMSAASSVMGAISPCARTMRPSDMLAALAAEEASRNRFMFIPTSIKADVASPQGTPGRGGRHSGMAEDDAPNNHTTPQHPSRVLSLRTPPPGVRTPLRSVMKPRFQTKAVDWEDTGAPEQSAPPPAGDVLNNLNLYARPPQLVEFLSMCDSSAQEAFAAGKTVLPQGAHLPSPTGSNRIFHRPSELHAAASGFLQERYYGTALGDAAMDAYVVKHMVEEVKAYYEAKLHSMSVALRMRQEYNAALAEDVAKQRRHNVLYQRALEFAIDEVKKSSNSAPSSARLSSAASLNRQSLVERMTNTIAKHESRISSRPDSRSVGENRGEVLKRSSHSAMGLCSLSSFATHLASSQPPRPTTMLDMTPSANPVRSHTASPVLAPQSGRGFKHPTVVAPASQGGGSPTFSW